MRARSRLSEDSHRSVLLLEAGPDWRPTDAAAEVRSLNPGLVIGDAKFERCSTRVAGEANAAARARAVLAGARHGWSSTINGILAIRPVPEDHDEWGLPGWPWDACCPRTAGSRPSTTSAATRGTVPTGRCRSSASRKSDGARSIKRSARRRSARATAGAPTTTRRLVQACRPTPSTAIRSARSGSPRTTRTSSRAATVRTCRIVGDALVDRVLVGSRAVGVRVQSTASGHDGGRRGGAQRGAVHSPAILLRSGIGPGLVVDLPVGQHLQDHPCASIGAATARRGAAGDTLRSPHQRVHALLVGPRRSGSQRHDDRRDEPHADRAGRAHRRVDQRVLLGGHAAPRVARSGSRSDRSTRT